MVHVDLTRVFPPNSDPPPHALAGLGILVAPCSAFSLSSGTPPPNVMHQCVCDNVFSLCGPLHCARVLDFSGSVLPRAKLGVLLNVS